MKNIIVTILIVLSCKILFAQNLNEQFNEQLSEINESINGMNKLVNTNLYGYVSEENFKNYQSRLSIAQGILDTIDKNYQEINKQSELFPNEKDYLIHGLLLQFTALSITANAGDYTEFLKLNKSNISYYNQINTTWQKKTSEYIKSIKTHINSLQLISGTTTYVKTLSSILLIYENKIPKAIRNLKSICDELKDAELKSPDKIAENSVREHEISFAQTWLGYAYFLSNKLDTAKLNFQLVKDSINEADNSMSFYCDNAINKLEKANDYCKNFHCMAVNYSERKKFFESHVLSYSSAGANQQKVKEAFSLTNGSTQLIDNPSELMVRSYNNWSRLVALQQSPAYKIIRQMKTCDGKLNKNNYREMYLKLSNSTGQSKENLIKFRERFDSTYAVLQEFLFLKKCWSELISNNGNIPLYRFYRVKVDLGIYFIAQHKDDYLEFFKYYKLDGNLIASHEMEQISNDFSFAGNQEIQDDISFCNQQSPNNLLFKLNELEASVLMSEPNTALKNIDAFADKLKTKNDNDYADAFGMLEVYKSYCYIKKQTASDVNQSIQTLGSFPDPFKWAEHLKEMSYFFNNYSNLKK